MNSSIKIFRYLKPYWKWAALAPLLMMLEVAMDLMQPSLIEKIVDQGIGQLNMQVVTHTGLLMIGLSIIGAFGGITNGIFSVMTSQGFAADLRESLFNKIQTLSFANLDHLETGNLITRLTNDVTQVQDAIQMGLRILVRVPLLFIGSLIMSFITCPQLAFLPIILMPIELIAVYWVIKNATPLYSFVQQKLDKLNTIMQENLSGIRVVKAFARVPYEQARFGEANDNLMQKSIQVAQTIAVMLPFILTTMNVGVVGVIWFGGIKVIQGQIMVGQIIAFVNYLTTTLFSLMMASNLIIQTARAGASVKRIQEVLDSEPAVTNRGDLVETSHLKGKIVFNHVAFSYNRDGSDLVLKDVDFSVEPGQKVAILGTTGAGKSSLIDLIPRFYDVTSGQITIDNIDVRDLDQKSLRKMIGVALQETVLFSGTIRENIRYGNPEATEEEVIYAAKIAEAHPFIQALPDGYDTILGQRGVNLSGGQKQRLAIARAILIKPVVLILDDSTSSVDIETETKIQNGLEEVMKNRTSLIIAQRISTVLNADKILVLDNGKIAAQGNHHELLASSPIYRDIYESQLGNGVAA